MEQNREAYMAKYNEKTHFYGRIGLWIGIILLLAAPFLFGVSLDAMPDLGAFGKGLAQIAIIYIPSCIVEFLIYMPMLGAGGSYLAFITGNLINMKIPCALNARDIVGTEAGTTEKLIAICEQNSLPVSCDFSTKTLLDGALSDKKRMGGRIALIIPEKLGKCMTHTVPVDELEHIIDLGKETSV